MDVYAFSAYQKLLQPIMIGLILCIMIKLNTTCDRIIRTYMEPGNKFISWTISRIYTKQPIPLDLRYRLIFAEGDILLDDLDINQCLAKYELKQ